MTGFNLAGWPVVQCSARCYYGVCWNVLLLLSNKRLMFC